MTELPSKPTLRVKEALTELLRRNGRTADREVAEMYLGSEIFVARLRRPRLVEGKFVDVDKTVDLFDLMDQHQREEPPVSRGPRPGAAAAD